MCRPLCPCWRRSTAMLQPAWRPHKRSSMTFTRTSMHHLPPLPCCAHCMLCSLHAVPRHPGATINTSCLLPQQMHQCLASEHAVIVNQMLNEMQPTLTNCHFVSSVSATSAPFAEPLTAVHNRLCENQSNRNALLVAHGKWQPIFWMAPWLKCR